MDKINKFLQKLSAKQRKQLLILMLQIQEESLEGLDVKKLSGLEGLYRVRVGNIRIVFSRMTGGNRLIDVKFRKDSYKGL